ncbi:MAG: Crp/Fnr family transcriptional regulator [Oligoflexia bacterium]|nr:Crp/Fnr family transcriptional regulator [Oligoflexia bacterium]
MRRFKVNGITSIDTSTNELFPNLEKNLLIKLKKQQVLFEENQYANHIFLVQYGYIGLYKGSTLIDIAEPKQLIGALFCVSPESALSNYPISAYSLGYSGIYSLEKNEFSRHAERSTKVKNFIMEQISNRMRFRQSCTMLQSSNACAKIKNILISKKNSLKSGYITQKSIAQLAGVSTETVTRFLNKWKKEKLLEMDNKCINLLNTDFFETT